MNLNMHFLGEMHVYFKGCVIILKVLFEPCILYLIKFTGINYTLVVVFNNCALDKHIVQVPVIIITVIIRI